MHILLTGKNGQLGFELNRSLLPLGHVTAIGRDTCDFSDASALSDLIKQLKPDVIVNPAAYTAVDKAETEQEKAHAINAIAPSVIGKVAADMGILVVHYSTDYVFDGTQKTAYKESDTPNPKNIYGLTKRLGEDALQASGARHLIFRTSWIAGVHGNNFAKTMLQLAAQKSTLKVVADQWGAPTSAALLANATAHVLRLVMQKPHHHFPSGIYHLTASGVTNWHEYACYVIEKARQAGQTFLLPSHAISPIATVDYPTSAHRPSNSQLDTHKFQQTFGLSLPDWRVGIDNILAQWFQK